MADMRNVNVTKLLRTFGWRMAAATLARWLLVVAFVLAIAAIGPFGTMATAKAATLSMLLVLLGWVLLVHVSIKAAQYAQLGAALLAHGDLEQAESALLRAMRSASVFRGALLFACQQFGALLAARKRYAEAARVFQTLLRYASGRFGSLRSLHASARLMLADCELAMGHLDAAYSAFRPVFDMPLTLSDKLMLLPIELRYALASGHVDSAVADLPDKVRHAEMLEAPQAAWVHVLLADACERTGRTASAMFLRRRAALYHDLNDLPSNLAVDVLATDDGSKTS
jgi:tetratricopeptide (TPR) repeat protein